MSQTTSNYPLPVYEQVANALAHQIERGAIGTGQKLPSQREICAQYGISSVTAKRAIRRLKARGLIETRAGARAVVARTFPLASPKQGDKVGLVLMSGHPELVYQHELECIAMQMQRHGLPMLLSVAELEEDIARMIDQQHAAGVNCLIFMPRHKQWVEEEGIIRHAAKAGLPLLILESSHEHEAYVKADVSQGIELAVAHLYELGHRRIMLISAYPPKIEAFERAMRDRPGTLPQLIRRSDHAHQAMVQVTHQLLAMPRLPTAVIASNDQFAEVIITHCLQTHVRIPQQLSVVGFDDLLPDQSQLPISLTSVRHPVQQIAQEAVRWAQLRFQTGRTVGRKLRRQVGYTLIARDSTGPCLET